MSVGTGEEFSTLDARIITTLGVEMKILGAWKLSSN
jgi:hypothetical protein